VQQTLREATANSGAACWAAAAPRSVITGYWQPDGRATMSGGGVGSEAGSQARAAHSPRPGTELQEQGGAAMETSAQEHAASQPAGGEEAGGSLPAAADDAAEVGCWQGLEAGSASEGCAGCLVTAVFLTAYLTKLPPPASVRCRSSRPAAAMQTVLQATRRERRQVARKR